MLPILAFDQSLNFAYTATRPSGRAPISCVERLPTDGENYGPALKAAKDIIAGAVAVHQPQEIWFESPMVVRGDNIVTTAQTIRLLFGLCAIIELVAHEAGIPVFEVNNSTWKKFFVGNGHAKKHETIARCAQLGWGKLCNNRADSCGVWAWAQACSDPEFAASLTPIFDGVAT